MDLAVAVSAFVEVCYHTERTGESIGKALFENDFGRPSSASTWTFYHNELNASFAFPPEDDGKSCSMVFGATETLDTVKTAIQYAVGSILTRDPESGVALPITVYGDVKGNTFLLYGPQEPVPSTFQVSLIGVRE